MIQIHPTLETEPWQLSSFNPPSNPSEGVARRIGFKRLEEETLDPMISTVVQLEQQVLTHGRKQPLARKLFKRAILQTTVAKLATSRTHLSAVSQVMEQHVETQNRIELDEMNKVTRHQIETKQARVKELEKLLNEKLENEKAMDSVRKQPSRIESLRDIDKLQRSIKIMQEQTIACQEKLESQRQEFKSAILKLMALQDNLQANINHRIVLRHDLAGGHLSAPEPMASISKQSSSFSLDATMDVDIPPSTNINESNDA